MVTERCIIPVPDWASYRSTDNIYEYERRKGAIGIANCVILAFARLIM